MSSSNLNIHPDLYDLYDLQRVIYSEMIYADRNKILFYVDTRLAWDLVKRRYLYLDRINHFHLVELFNKLMEKDVQ